MATRNQVNTGLNGSTGSDSFVGSNSGVIASPILGAASATSISFSSTSGVIGTSTNDDAVVGSVGQYASSIIASPGSSITTNTNTNITSISLTAGDWDVWGSVGFTGNPATKITFIAGWVSSTSATRPDPSLYSSFAFASAMNVIPYAQGAINIKVPKRRFSLASTTTVYVTAFTLFTISTTTAYGAIYARRVR